MSSERLPQYVFVYGTLRAGEANDINRLRPTPIRLGRAMVRGWLYDCGSYPGLVLDDSAEPVFGDVYRIFPALIPVLDEIEEVYPGEKDEYAKRVWPVRCAGQILRCLVYEMNPRYTEGRPLIAEGDWVRYRKARDA